jgi:hypothetical protein
MSNSTLKNWLSTPRNELKSALKESVRAHIETIKSQYSDLYGYAIVPNESYEVTDFVVAFNRKSDIKQNTIFQNSYKANYQVQNTIFKRRALLPAPVLVKIF